MIPASRLSTEFYNIDKIDDYRHEYLRLWISDAFNEQMFTILNEWSQRWNQHQDSRQNGAQNTKIL